MTNRKIKKYNIHRLAKVLERARDIDYCGVWLALLDSGISRPKVLEFYDYFHEHYVPKLVQDSDDGVLSHKIIEFLKDVQIVPEYFERVPRRHTADIQMAFITESATSKALQSNCTDFMVLMYCVHSYFGYGHLRLMRIVHFIMNYTGDARQEVFNRLNIKYSADDELPDTTEIFKKQRAGIDAEHIEKISKEFQMMRKGE